MTARVTTGIEQLRVRVRVRVGVGVWVRVVEDEGLWESNPGALGFWLDTLAR